MDTFVKDEMASEVPAMKYIKQNDPFMPLRTSAWGPLLGMSIGKQAITVVRAVGMPSLSGQKIQKTKELVLAMSKEKMKESGRLPQRLKGRR